MPEGTPSTTGIPMPPPDPAIMARRQAIVDGLAGLVPAANLIVSEDERRAYETDAFTAYRAVPLAVELPETTEEVAAILTLASTRGCYAGASLIVIGNLVTGAHSFNGDSVELVENEYFDQIRFVLAALLELKDELL